MSILLPAFDPIAVSLGPIIIRWYALSYIAGIMFGWWYIRYLDSKGLKLLTRELCDDIIFYAVLGIILGGRVGYVLFYNLPFFLDNPSHIFHVWEGGMSFHGGMLGFIAAIGIFCHRKKLPFFAVMDPLACSAPVGLFLGRIANFINGELYGRETDMPWGMVFPHGGNIVRHPSQLYEAALEGLALFILLAVVRGTEKGKRLGVCSGLFLIGYALARSFVEHFREPDEQLGFLFASVTMGQLLSAPMVLFGAWLIYRALKKEPAHAG